MLRDLAAMLSGTKFQFDIDFDLDAQTVSVTTGKEYTPVGGDRSASCKESIWTVTVDGKPVTARAYDLGGNNFFRLRDMGEAIGFGVDYDYPDNFAVVTALDGVVYQRARSYHHAVHR